MLRLAVVSLTIALATGAEAEQTVVGGLGNDYQASIIQRWNEPDSRIVVFERLDGSFSGNLWITRSDDGGVNWSDPAQVIATVANERHAALVQTGDDAFALFHLSNGTGSFRIHRATSTDGETFTSQGAINLGWLSGGEINPHVIRETDGTLTLTYHRLGGASYIAQSTDDGATWDTQMTQVSPGTAALPRIALRESDGTYLLVYQTGSNPVTLWTKTSVDAYDWSASAQQFTPDGNNHDALPVVMSDDSFVIVWARVANGAFQIFSARSADGLAWQPWLQHSDRPNLANIQPHALTVTDPRFLELYWGAGQVPGDGNYDIVREPYALVADSIFAHDFEPDESEN